MKLSLKEAINIYRLMQAQGVVLYGGVQDAKLALETLENEGISVKAIAGKNVGRMIANKQIISIGELCEQGKNEVCIIAPLTKEIQDEVYKELKTHFDIVLDNFIVHWIAYFFPHDMGELEYMSCFPFNHYESPYSQQSELEVYRHCKNMNELLDLNLNLEFQIEFLPKLENYGRDFLKKMEENKFRYQSKNSYYGNGDAVLLHSVIREWHSRKVIEIGSGFSTCVVLDTREYWSDCSDITITCIEPYPERLYSRIKDSDEIDIRRTFVQNVNLKEFESLEENDILFIDSSHVTRTGGDIPYEYFEILPRLKSGVLIHIHDMFYPFTYPEKWVLDGRAYNETYVLRALLMNSNRYQIVFWNDLMLKRCSSLISENNFPQNFLDGGSLWLRKC